MAHHEPLARVPPALVILCGYVWWIERSDVRKIDFTKESDFDATSTAIRRTGVWIWAIGTHARHQ
jgi:hypothetical protein